MNDIKIDFNINGTINEIENYVNEIDNNLKRLYEISLIDKSMWNTRESEIYETDYLNYVKDLSIRYPLYLRNYLEFLKSTISKYMDIDLEQNKKKEDI